MPYPPPVPPATRTDATVMATNHPSDHNVISAALTEILNHLAVMEQSLYPIGVIAEWGGAIAPPNHEFCRGQAVSRSANPEVFAIIGTAFGAGDGSTTFNLPSYSGRSPMGLWPGGSWATAMGQMLGSSNSSLPSHQHGGIDHIHGVSITTGDDLQNHYHYPDSGGGFVMSGSGSGGSAGIGPGVGYSLGLAAGRSNVHQHAVNGATQGATVTSTGFAGVDPTNTNIHPSIVVNFIMRMH